jgi:hypothetical protein
MTFYNDLPADFRDVTLDSSDQVTCSNLPKLRVLFFTD